MSRFGLVAMGGTFDVIHRGHVALLEMAFSVSQKVIIGLTSDELVQRKGKRILHTYEQRLESLKKTVDAMFPGRQYVISRLDNDFGPAVVEGKVEALVVSEETAHQGQALNKLREDRNLGPVDVVVVPMVLAKDGKRISSTRIRNEEMDRDGNLI